MANEDDDELDLERSPLNVPEILQTISGYISNLEDMRNFRGVSNKWREVILKNWRESATVQITLGLINKFYEEENEVFLNNGLYDPEEGQYVKMRLTENPFKNYIVPFFHTSFPPALERIQERFFWNRMGPCMKILDLEQCIFPDNLALEGLEWILLKQCRNLEELRMKPYKCSKRILKKLEAEDLDCEIRETVQENSLTNENLKTLTISCVQLDTENGFSELFNDFESRLSRQFFRMIPNLKSLSVKVSKSLLQILTGLRHANQGLDMFQLETLIVDGSSSRQVPEVFDSLQNYFLFSTFATPPPLKKLKIRSNWSDRTQRGMGLNVILEPVVNTLKILEITPDLYKPNILRDCKFDFEELEFTRLERLILRYNLASMQKQMGSVAFPSLKSMPRLKEFRFECTGPTKFKGFLSNPDNMKMEDLRMPLLPAQALGMIPLQFGELEELHFCGRFTQAGMQHLGRCAPKLKRFGAICEIESVRAAVTAFDQLEELQVLPGSRVGDKDLQTLRNTYPGITIKMV